jgi:hypothetical protein
MNYRYRILLPVILSTGILLTGCQVSQFWTKLQTVKQQPNTAQGTVTASQEATLAKTNTLQEPAKQVSTTQANSTVVSDNKINDTPKTETKSIDQLKLLDSIEYNSGNIFFDIIKFDWNAAQKKVAVIKDNLITLNPALNSSSVSPGLIEEMDKAADNLDKSIAAAKIYDSKEESNKLTSIIADIEDAYNVKSPTDILRLGYLSREIHLNINTGDWKSAGNNYKEAEDTWKKLKIKTGDNYKDEVEEAENILTKLGDSVEKKDASLAVTASNQLLWKLTDLKNAFNRQ